MEQPSASDRNPAAGGERPVTYEWHPAIRALGWLVSWCMFAVSTAIVWEFFATGSLDRGPVLARGIWILAALALLTFVLLLVDAAGHIAQRAWDNYDARTARKLYIVAIVLFLATAVPYLWFVSWLLELLRPRIFAWFSAVEPWPRAPEATPSWLVRGLLSVLSVALAWYVFRLLRRGPFYAYRNALRTLGPRKAVAGVLLMAYLRLLAPRKDLFVQGPIVSWMLPLALLVLLHLWIPIEAFAWIVPLLLLACIIPFWAATLAPPQWLYIGRSDFESFSTFYGLRARWRHHGLTLLDRTGYEGTRFYYAWLESVGTKPPIVNPAIARVWSIRTRPAVWQTAVRLLAAFVPLIVIDRTRHSEIVEWEIDWLIRRGYMDKAFVLVSPEAVSTDDGLPAGVLRVPDVLLASQWSPFGPSLGDDC